MLAGARCDGLCAHRYGRVELVVHGLDSHHWLPVTKPPHGVRVGGWHLLLQRWCHQETQLTTASVRLRLLHYGMVLPVMLGAVAQQQHSVKINNNERLTIHTIA